MSYKRILAFDFGASSGRAILGTLENGKIEMKEIHRFSNDPVSVCGTVYWDILRLFFEIKTGITKAVAEGGFDAVSIDTWGVDFGLLDKDGKLLGNPVHYRDVRTEPIPEEVLKVIPKDELYNLTGIQFNRINTLYQLMYLKLKEPETLARTEKMLMIPDLFAYMLTGEIHEEATIASTSNIYDGRTKNWSFELIEKLGLPKSIFADIIEPGSVYGNLSPEICEELGCESVPVIACASHDTASAVAAVPSVTDDFVYVSCGTWSLFGIETREPIVTPEAAQYNFTNEGGFDNTTRFLKNITGLWLIQESRRQWKREGTEVGFDVLEKEALASEPFKCFIDVDDPLFETAGNLPRRVQEYCRKTGQYVPANRGEIMRCIYQSLAMKYRYTFDVLKDLGKKDYSHINIVGGGTKDGLLCQMVAESCNTEIFAGPIEATALGNIAVALYALDELADLKEIRKVVSDSTELKHYSPTESDAWNEAYGSYLKILNLNNEA